MPNFAIACPHCSTPKAGMVYQHAILHPRAKAHVLAFSVCGVCSAPVIVEFIDQKPDGNGKAKLDQFRQTSGNPDALNFKVLAILPKPAPATTPLHLPAAVQQAYEDGEFNSAHQRWNSAGMALRRALDVGTKTVAPQIKAATLHQRLVEMAKQQLLTMELADWAQHLKNIGNAANHDVDEFTEAEAKFMLELTRLVLTYIFTLPEMVKLAKAAATPAAPAPAATP